MSLFDLFKKNKKCDATTTKPNVVQNNYSSLFMCEMAKANESFENGTVNGRQVTLEEANDIIYKCRALHEMYLETLYDFTTVEGVRKIPVGEYIPPVTGGGGTSGTHCYNLDYVLRSKATKLKNTNIDLAVACLQKANEISFYSNYTYEKDYMRVVEYLKNVGRFDEARREEEYIRSEYLSNHTGQKSFSSFYDEKSPFYFRSDLVESTGDTFVCAECAKYTKRRFTEYGHNTKYPLLPKYFKENLPEHKHCAINFYPVIEGTTTAWECPYDIVAYSNRPFVDERTAEEKQAFENEVAKRERAVIIKEEYDWLCEFLPELAPKSLSAYSRMKNIKSDKYIEIFESAKEKGKYLIN